MTTQHPLIAKGISRADQMNHLVLQRVQEKLENKDIIPVKRMFNSEFDYWETQLPFSQDNKFILGYLFANTALGLMYYKGHSQLLNFIDNHFQDGIDIELCRNQETHIGLWYKVFEVLIPTGNWECVSNPIAFSDVAEVVDSVCEEFKSHKWNPGDCEEIRDYIVNTCVRIAAKNFYGFFILDKFKNSIIKDSDVTMHIASKIQ